MRRKRKQSRCLMHPRVLLRFYSSLPITILKLNHHRIKVKNFNDEKFLKLQLHKAAPERAPIILNHRLTPTQA